MHQNHAAAGGKPVYLSPRGSPFLGFLAAAGLGAAGFLAAGFEAGLGTNRSSSALLSAIRDLH